MNILLKNANVDKVRSLQNLREKLLPADDLDRLYQDLFAKLQEFLNPSRLLVMDKLYHLIEQDYKRQGFIRKGYHCLEHNMEVTLLALEACKKENNAEELLELAVSALLHDYDPQRTDGVPRVERTIYVLKTDEVLSDFLGRLELRLSNIVLLIERTDYPFSFEKEVVWNGKLLLHFPTKKGRELFINKAERLALIDKAATYFYLTPEKAHERVKGLAEEIHISADDLLRQTYGFLVRERIAEAGRWLPEVYRNRWAMVERHFQNLALGLVKQEK